MRSGWRNAKLDDICIVEYGTRVVQKRDGGTIYPVYGVGGETFAMDIFNREDRVVIARFGMSERCARFVHGKFFLNDSGLTLAPRDPGRLLQAYLNHWIFSVTNELFALGKGTAQKNLDLPAFRCLEVPIPPVPKQQHIVTILDEAFEGIATAKANAEKNLQNARELFESERESKLAGNGLGWRSAPLSELCSIKHGFAFQGEFFRSEGRYVLLTPGNFFEAGGYRDRDEKQKYYIGDIPDGYILSKGDLLVAMTEQAAGLLGSPILVPASDRFLHNQRLGLVTGNPDVPWCDEYFFHVFNTKGLRAAVHTSGSGVKVRHTSPSKIGDVIVSFPTDVGIQSEIAAAIQNLQEECDKLARTYSQKLDALDELKQSLLHRAFNGDL